MMYQEITKSAFCNDKRLRENFSYEGLCALYDNLNEHEQDCELDVVALCCDYAEDELENVLKSYNLASLDELHGETYVVWEDKGRVLYQQF